MPFPEKYKTSYKIKNEFSCNYSRNKTIANPNFLMNSICLTGFGEVFHLMFNNKNRLNKARGVIE